MALDLELANPSFDRDLNKDFHIFSMLHGLLQITKFSSDILETLPKIENYFDYISEEYNLAKQSDKMTNEELGALGEIENQKLWRSYDILNGSEDFISNHHFILTTIYLRLKALDAHVSPKFYKETYQPPELPKYLPFRLQHEKNEAVYLQRKKEHHIKLHNALEEALLHESDSKLAVVLFEMLPRIKHASLQEWQTEKSWLADEWETELINNPKAAFFIAVDEALPISPLAYDEHHYLLKLTYASHDIKSQLYRAAPNIDEMVNALNAINRSYNDIFFTDQVFENYTNDTQRSFNDFTPNDRSLHSGDQNSLNKIKGISSAFEAGLRQLDPLFNIPSTMHINQIIAQDHQFLEDLADEKNVTYQTWLEIANHAKAFKKTKIIAQMVANDIMRLGNQRDKIGQKDDTSTASGALNQPQNPPQGQQGSGLPPAFGLDKQPGN